MNLRLQNKRTSVATAAIILLASAAALTQTRWMKAAPFPEPDEELYGISASGKMYVIGGFGGGRGRGINYEYDPATDKWTMKKPMARVAHHEALAEYRG